MIDRLRCLLGFHRWEGFARPLSRTFFVESRRCTRCRLVQDGERLLRSHAVTAWA